MRGWPVGLLRYLGCAVPLEGWWHVGGHAWATSVSDLQYMADRPNCPRLSFVVVFEDGRALPRPHASHQEIRELGAGRFLHWGAYVVFSTTDNTSPDENGRRYTYSRGWWSYRRHYHRWPVTGAPRGQRIEPVNYRVHDLCDEAIEEQVDSTLAVVDGYLERLERESVSLAGASVLEVGPGQNLGTALCLVALGARVVVADRFPPSWDAVYHPRIYRALRRRLGRDRPHWDPRPFDEVLAAGRHDEVITCHPTAAESLRSIADASVDIVLTNAVLEHVTDVAAAFSEMARVTKPGGLGIHQVDHGDHRDRARPLDFLLMPDDRFAKLFKAVHGECGNRLRRREVEAMAKAAGFAVSEVEVQAVADSRYARALARRLEHAAGSSYAGFDRAAIEEISCRYTLRRLGAGRETVDDPARGASGR